jgi:DNA modification methylase
MHTNAIYCGDARNVLGNTLEFPNECVDLVYIDPPFFSNRKYEVLWGDGYEKRAFEDRWKGGVENYVAWMELKLSESWRILKTGGSLFLHCDWHANAHLRIQMDQIVGGPSNFVNEIIWKRQSSHSDVGQGAAHLGRIHDVILFYAKGGNGPKTWHPLYEPHRAENLDRHYRWAESPSGEIITLKAGDPVPPGWRRFRNDNLTAAKPGGDTSYEWKGRRPYKGRYWMYSREKMEELEKEGLLLYTKTGMPEFKRFLATEGTPVGDVWTDIGPINSQAKERLGYPTQKPIDLLKRIIALATDEGDVVLDPMCGCGTAVAAAYELKRNWVGIDISPTACRLMIRRMHSLGADVSIDQIIGLPKSEAQLRSMQPIEFQNEVMRRLMGRASAKSTGDMGIDGYLFDGSPVQVKQSEDVGRNVIDNFETAIKRAKKTKGMIVAISFGKGAHEEVARAKNQDGVEITLKTLEELMGEE